MPSSATRGRLALLLVCVLAWLHAASFLGSGPFDDDFIVYRYARNWVLGEGLVFNVGERFEGFTVPLWVMVIAGGLRLGLDPVTVSLTLSILATGLAAFAVGAAWRLEFPDARLPVPALLLAATPIFAWHGVTGLGTTVLAALLALAWLYHARACLAGKPAWGAAIWLALACFMRQECALFALPFLVLELRRVRSLAPLLPVLALLGWTVFRYLYYGRLLPITYTVKKLSVAADLGYGLRYFGQATLECGVGALLALGLCAPRAVRRELRAPTRCALAGLLLHSAYVVWVGGDFMPFARFFVPTLPLLFLFACFGARRLLPARPRVRALALTVALALLQWPQLGLSETSRQQRAFEHAFFEERWAALGRHLGAVLPPNTSVAISPIGAFGWYSGLPIVDILGLTHDAALDEEPDLSIHMKGHHRTDAAWVFEQRPALMILANGVQQPGTGELAINPWERTIYEDPRFAERYVPTRMPIPESEPLIFFKRTDVPAPPGARVIRR
ncbi:MAG: hypothetical protein E2O39_06085 [Planctomycetota bacterium]|nr:MAG: hypothetical protein E2O39_06085 [Planctomycetota bacterium]